MKNSCQTLIFLPFVLTLIGPLFFVFYKDLLVISIYKKKLNYFKGEGNLTEISKTVLFSYILKEKEETFDKDRSFSVVCFYYAFFDDENLNLSCQTVLISISTFVHFEPRTLCSKFIMQN